MAEVEQVITFRVSGVPAPGGSKSVVFMRAKSGKVLIRNGFPVYSVVDSGKGNKKWRRLVRDAALKAWKPEPVECPLRVTFTFFMPRPKGHYGTGRNAMVLKDSAPRAHITKPDVVKLARSTEDALTGVVWKDDSQVIEELMRKQYCTKGPGALIMIECLRVDRELPLLEEA